MGSMGDTAKQRQEAKQYGSSSSSSDSGTQPSSRTSVDLALSEAVSEDPLPLHLLNACGMAGRRSITSVDMKAARGAPEAAVADAPPDGARATATAPVLSHRMTHDKSILALAVSERYIFAGTQGGEILVYSLETYERRKVIEAHRGSVLGLCLSQDQSLLFSSATDPIVNVWCTSNFRRLYALWSPYDVGDIFCVAYSSYHQTVYLGAQNTSIQWYDLKEKDLRPRPTLASHPSERKNRFFDSTGPGGVQTPKPHGADGNLKDAVGGQYLEIDKQDVLQFAHYGYVYCMLLGKAILPEAPLEEILVSGGGDGRIVLWRIDADNGGAISNIYTLEDGREEGESILSIARDGSFLYSGRFDGEVNVWDLETRQLVRRLKADTGDVLSLSLGGGYLFAGGLSGHVHKYNQYYETVSTFRAHSGLILASAFTTSKDKATFVTGGNDNTVVIWDVQDCAGPSNAKRSNNGKDLMVEALNEFVSLRTVSSLPKYRADCRRGASFLRRVFRNFGAVTEMLNTAEPYNPIVYAKFQANPATAGKRKKILFYGHYDVIAAENEHGKWKHDPFTLTGEGGYLYGRGISDNKGPIMAAIYAAHELANEQSLGSDIIFLIEGEEESGSRGFEQAIQAKKELIGDIDWILLANSYWLDDHVPCLTYGLRGVIHATVQVESKHPDLHSGVDGSALLDEPLKDLVMLLSKLTGPHGKVQIPAFYDPILPLTEEESKLYAEIASTLLRGNPDLGDAEELAQSLMRRWREASLTIHRFQTSGPDNSTIIPRLAKASLSIRLVPNQEAHAVASTLKAFLESVFMHLDSKNTLKVTIDHQAEPWLGDLNNEIFQTLESAVKAVWGPSLGRRQSPDPTTSSTLANGSNESASPSSSPDPSLLPHSPSPPQPPSLSHPHTLQDPLKPLYIREGGSIPSIRFLEKVFGAPAAHLPCGQASDSAHLDNERLRLVNLYHAKGIFRRVFGVREGDV
ncbi:glutathione degradosome [Massarina eburnea CBS 473.64]|uniref:Glutathione degradosome n=1 Tax=Massarina eburnea CBS 473.64 TaxID=1395130 RepID=A0A6A6RJZ0_9PLEO|nr:glutathione degradosome [Massarina eburnea CBS 473.64]